MVAVALRVVAAAREVVDAVLVALLLFPLPFPARVVAAARDVVDVLTPAYQDLGAGQDGRKGRIDSPLLPLFPLLALVVVVAATAVVLVTAGLFPPAP